MTNQENLRYARKLDGLQPALIFFFFKSATVYQTEALCIFRKDVVIPAMPDLLDYRNRYFKMKISVFVKRRFF